MCHLSGHGAISHWGSSFLMNFFLLASRDSLLRVSGDVQAGVRAGGQE
jgi:hypothetical protein